MDTRAEHIRGTIAQLRRELLAWARAPWTTANTSPPSDDHEAVVADRPAGSGDGGQST
jgi:hypothetical protein